MSTWSGAKGASASQIALTIVGALMTVADSPIP